MQNFWSHPVDTVRKLNVHKTFRRRPGRSIYDLYLRSKVIAAYSKEATKKVLKSLLFQLLGRKLKTPKYSDSVMKELDEFIDNDKFVTKTSF